MERPGCSIPDAAETTPVRDPLLHPRPRRLSDRSRANHGPTGGLVARSLAMKSSADPDGRLRAGEGRRTRTVGPARGGRRPPRSCSRPRQVAVIDRRGLIASPPWPGAPLRPGLRPDGLDGARCAGTALPPTHEPVHGRGPYIPSSSPSDIAVAVTSRRAEPAP